MWLGWAGLGEARLGKAGQGRAGEARLDVAVGYEARGDRVQAEHHLGMAPSGQARKIRACWWMTTAIVALRAVRCSTGRW